MTLIHQTIYSETIPAVGSYIAPAGWHTGSPLIPSDWAAAPFRIELPRLGILVACDVTITGRTVVFKRNANWVRVRIDFIHDGEDNSTISGLMKLS